MADTTRQKFFQNQGYHLLAWVIIGSILYLESRRYNISGTMRIWGWSAGKWLFLSWVFAALHQGWVWFFWRLELYRGKITDRFGPGGFLGYRIGFVLFASVRLFPLVPISLATERSLLIPRWLSFALIVITMPFIIWGLFSVVMYFGINRAFGADHFEERYREGGLEKRGIFKYVPNAMYTVVLLALYHPGLLVGSRLGLVAALGHHLFVWTHYFCTERPDMKEIYREKSDSKV